MTSARLGRLVLVKQRVRDASRARVVDAERALEEHEALAERARIVTRAAVEGLRTEVCVSASDLELRARRVVESEKDRAAAEAACEESGVRVVRERDARLEAERDLKLLSRVEERMRDAERVEVDRRDDREMDDRVAATRRSA